MDLTHACPYSPRSARSANNLLSEPLYCKPSSPALNMHCPDMQIGTCLLSKGINEITPSENLNFN